MGGIRTIGNVAYRTEAVLVSAMISHQDRFGSIGYIPNSSDATRKQKR